MDSEAILWIKLWQLAAAIAIVAIVTFGGCDVYRKHAILEMVNGGANPIAANCAIEGIAMTEALCLEASRQ